MDFFTNKFENSIKQIEDGEISIHDAKYLDEPLLCAAIEYDFISIAEKLIALGANVNEECSGFLDRETPLMIACDKENLSLIKNLISKGANVNQKDSDGETAFHVACEKGNIEIIKYLSSKGANIDTVSNNGYTPLMKAIVNKQTKIAKFLLKRNVNIEQLTTRGYTVMDLAILELQPSVIERLISKGVDINRVDTNRNTYLHHIVIYTRNNFLWTINSNKVIQIIQLLIDNGVGYTLKNQQGNTALDLAELYGLYEISDMLQELIGENEENEENEYEENNNESHANLNAVPPIPNEYNKPILPRFIEIPPNTDCFSPMNASEVKITNDKIIFYIFDKHKQLENVSCIDTDSHELLENVRYLYYKCRDTVPLGATFVNRTQVYPEPLRRLALQQNFYVYESQIKKVKPGHRYALIPTELPIGRIVSETLLQTQYAVGAEHCATNYSNVIYTLFEVVTPPTLPPVIPNKPLTGRNRSKSFRKTRRRMQRNRTRKSNRNY